MEIQVKYKRNRDFLRDAENFRQLKSIFQFKRMMAIEVFHLSHLINKPQYLSFRIPKKKGGFRKIHAPKEDLKSLQQKLNYYLQALYLSCKPNSVYGFVFNPFTQAPLHTIVSNAARHCNKKQVLNMDLQDFFPSISAKRVKTALMDAPYQMEDKISTLVALLGSFEKKLPTGAPTSPVLSNMVCYKMDIRLEQYCLQHHITYTRYADDLTFSSDAKMSLQSIEEIKQIILNHGFILNAKKYRLQSSKAKQTVTGLVVNTKANIDRKYLRRLRAIAYSIEKMGLELACAKHYRLTDLAQADLPKFYRKIAGQIEFVGQVRGKTDNMYLNLKQKLKMGLLEG
jgi:RNA-directed DNA polymerase